MAGEKAILPTAFICFGIIYIRCNYKGKKASNIKFQIAFGGREAVGREHGCGRSHWSFKCTGNVLYLKVGVRTRVPWCLLCVFMLCIYNMTFFYIYVALDNVEQLCSAYYRPVRIFWNLCQNSATIVNISWHLVQGCLEGGQTHR